MLFEAEPPHFQTCSLTAAAFALNAAKVSMAEHSGFA
jgi:hypothetical protein